MAFFSQLWEIGLSPQLNPHPPHAVHSPAATTITVTSLPIHSAQGYNASLSLTSDQRRGHGGRGGGGNLSITALVYFCGS